MKLFGLSLVLKFLTGVILVQGAAAILAYAAMKSADHQVWLLYGGIALITGFLAALWFSSIAGHFTKDAVAQTREGFSRERERIKVRAEREKTKVIKQSHQQISRERNRARNNASMKTGLSFVAVAGLGILLLLSQFVTVGLLTLTTAGGALGGYLFRARQERGAAEPATPGLAAPTTRLLGARLLDPVRSALARKLKEPGATAHK